jgi:uncharacterized membrane protein
VTVLVFVHLLAACVWIGGFVVIAVVARIVRRQLGPAEQVAFFRALGRGYGVVGGSALAVALGSGAALLDRHGWDTMAVTAAALGLALALVTVAGVRQARAMTRLRRRWVGSPADEDMAAQVRRGARQANMLRAAIGVLTLALLAIGAALVS